MDRHRLIELGTSVADGAALDWTSVRQAVVDEADHRVLAELQLLEGVARVHRHGSRRTTDDSPAHDGVRQAWGRLQNLEWIARGSFGDVYRAHDPHLDRPVALKLLRQRDPDQESLDSAVIHEARLLARVRHPNVVTVFGAERVNGRTGIWMEFVEGQSLDAEVRNQGLLAADEVVRIGIDLCRALDAIHRAGVLHRDLKAQNVLRGADGRVLITDFGAGRDIVRDADASAAGDRAGTPMYLAPEVLAGGPASHASDVYGLGVLLWYLTTGAFPVTGRTLAQLRDAHARGVRATLRSQRPDVPAPFARILERATSADPTSRHADAARLEADLVRFAGHPRRRRRAMAAVAVVGAVVASVLVANRWPPGSTPTSVSASLRRLSPAWINDVLVRGGVAPDGKWLVCLRDHRFARCDITTGVVTPFTEVGRVTNANVALSHDGRHLAYHSNPADGMEIRITGTDGRGDRLLHKRPPGQLVDAGSWSGDGTMLAAKVTGPSGPEFMLLSAADGAVRASWPIPGGPIGRFQLSPDARFAAFSRRGEREDDVDVDLWMLNVADGLAQPLLTGASRDAQPLWFPGGRELLFTSTRSGALGLWHVPVDDGQLAGPPMMLQDFARARLTPIGFTADGALHYTVDGIGFDVYAGAVDLDAATVLELPNLVTRDPAVPSAGAAWSPDGSLLAFQIPQRQTDASPSRVIVRSLTGGGEHSLDVDRGYYQVGLQWADDSRSLWRTGGRGLTRIDGRTGEKLETIDADRETRHSVVSARQEIAWIRAQGIWRRDLQTGRDTPIYQIRPGELLYSGLAMSPDHRRFAIAGADMSAKPPRHFLRIVDAVAGSTTDAFTSPFELEAGAWSSDGRYLLFARQLSRQDERSELAVLTWPSGEVRPVPVVFDQIREIRLHPDDRRVAFVAGSATAQLWVIDGPIRRP